MLHKPTTVSVNILLCRREDGRWKNKEWLQLLKENIIRIFYVNQWILYNSLSLLSAPPKTRQMWTSARPSLGSVKEETASTLSGLSSANALLDTNLMKCHKNVKVRNIRLRSWGWGASRTQISDKLFFKLFPIPLLSLSFLWTCKYNILSRNNMSLCYWTRKTLQLFPLLWAQSKRSIWIELNIKTWNIFELIFGLKCSRHVFA